MQIREMTREESVALLLRNRLGRIACVREGQPYITPIHFAYNADYLYCFSTVGQKIEWMRTSPLVCLEADEIESSNTWATVIVLGEYGELPKTPEFEEARRVAAELLQRQPMWWEPASSKLMAVERELELVHFRIHVLSMSGRRAVPAG